MIESFTDHAANERTYLAWIRTALALMGFGLLIERFDLFVRTLPALPAAARRGDPWIDADAAGLGLILMGVLVLAISTARYLRFKQRISSPERVQFRASRTDLLLVAVVCVIGLGMSVYVTGEVLR